MQSCMILEQLQLCIRSLACPLGALGGVINIKKNMVPPKPGATQSPYKMAGEGG